jgi:hypothetical protein
MEALCGPKRANEPQRHEDTKGKGGSRDDSPDAVLDARHVEIDQQSEAMAGELQIGKQLGLEHGLTMLNCLELNDNAVRDQQIDSQPRIETQTSINNAQVELSLERKAALRKLVEGAAYPSLPLRVFVV